MSKKQDFINFLDTLMNSNPKLTDELMTDDIATYINVLKDSDSSEKPLFTENGAKILLYMKEHLDIPLMKARDIAEGMMVSSRTVSGAIRKLVTDGYVEKVGQEPVIYALTEKGKNIVIN